MRRLALIIILLPALAWGQGLPDLQRQGTRLEAHRGRLETLLAAQVRRIARLKAQKAGIQRDYQLKSALRENQALATRLNALQDQIRKLNGQLIAAYDQALSQMRDPAERAKIQARRDTLARQSVGHIVTGEKANPLDSAEDLEEKADLLRDSEEKVRRQLKLIRSQIRQLETRARLKRHGRAVDDSPFIEESPRRLARANTSSAKTAADDRTSDPATPGPAEHPPTGFETSAKATADLDNGAHAGAGGGGGSESIATRPDLTLSMHGVMDPGVLKELRAASKSGNVTSRIAALQKAQKQLEQMARKLDQQSKDLRKRARTRH